MRYVYVPAPRDEFEPMVLKGKPIRPGETVTIISNGIPLGAFVWIADSNGNEQAVYKTALRPTK